MQFEETMHYLPQRLKLKVFFLNFSNRAAPIEGDSGVMKKFQKTLILAFELVVQPPKHTFEIAFFYQF